jgi:hypothetical protein
LNSNFLSGKKTGRGYKEEPEKATNQQQEIRSQIQSQRNRRGYIRRSNPSNGCKTFAAQASSFHENKTRRAADSSLPRAARSLPPPFPARLPRRVPRRGERKPGQAAAACSNVAEGGTRPPGCIEGGRRLPRYSGGEEAGRRREVVAATSAGIHREGSLADFRIRCLQKPDFADLHRPPRIL